MDQGDVVGGEVGDGGGLVLDEVAEVLKAGAVGVEELLVEASAAEGLDELDLGVAGVAEGEVHAVVAGTAAVGGVVDGDVFDAEEAGDAQGVDEETARRRAMSGTT